MSIELDEIVENAVNTTVLPRAEQRKVVLPSRVWRQSS
jgi:hypothetical protein